MKEETLQNILDGYSEISKETMETKYEEDFKLMRGLTDQGNVNDFQKFYDAIKYQIQECDILISDDSGGRIPTLFLRRIYEKRFGKAPKTLFLPGGQFYPNERYKNELKIFLERFGIHQSNPLILVTEHIMSGESISKIFDILKKLEYFHLKIFSMTIVEENSYYRDIIPLLFSGKEKESFSFLYEYRQFSGVSKKSGVDRSYIKKKSHIPQWIINQVRADIKSLVDMIQI